MHPTHHPKEGRPLSRRKRPCRQCGRPTFDRPCARAYIHGTRTVPDLLTDPATTLATIEGLLPLARRADVVALARRRPHSARTREIAIDALAWYGFAPEVEQSGRVPTKHMDPAEHARLTEPARAVLDIDDLTGSDVVALAARLARCSADYYLVDELKTLCDHPRFTVAAAYQCVAYAGRSQWGDHPATPVFEVLDVLESRGYPADITVQLMRQFRVGQMPRLFADIAATPGIAPVLETLRPDWTGKLSQLVATARSVLAPAATA